MAFAEHTSRRKLNTSSKSAPQKILWVDLEMTGLDAAHDRIVEVAAIVTDWDFNELASLESGVGHDAAVLARRFAASPYWSAHTADAKKLADLSANSPAERQVAGEVRALIDTHFAASQPVLLAGNSIHCDRGFIKRWWPEVEERLHYRMLDVSAWKVVMQGKFGMTFTKKEVHRALSDIRESIAELTFYLERTKL